MADQEPINRGNGSDSPEDAPQVAAIAQYIKDLSVESPSAPHVFQWQAQPQLDVQFAINVERIADDVHEVALKVDVAARSDQGTHFLIDLSYGGLFGIRNVPEDALPPILLIEAPRLLFPFVRQIIADATQQTGFPPLLLDPINFEAAYVAQMQAAQSQGAANGAVQGPEGEQAPTEGEESVPSASGDTNES